MNLKPMIDRSCQSAARRHRPLPGRPARAATCVIAIAIGLILLIAAPSPAGHSRWKAPSITTIDRPWITEAEFDADASLHATERQTVVFDLEPRTHGRGFLQKNRIRFLVEEGAEHAFCIPEDDPHLVRLKLKHRKGRTVLNGRRGGRCEPRWLAPGDYELTLYHDGRSVPSGGGTAFLHRPKTPFLFGSSDTSLVIPDFTVLRGADGRYVTDAASSPLQPLELSANTVGPNEVWRVALDPDAIGVGNLYILSDGNHSVVKFQELFGGGDGIDAGNLFFAGNDDPNNSGCCNSPAAPFRIRDLGSGKVSFTFVYNKSGTSITEYLFVNTDDELEWGDQGPATFTWDYKGFDCGTECGSNGLPLQEGEVALFAGCDYTGPAIVFQADTPRLSIYDAAAEQGLAMGNDMVASVRVGPNTLAFLYADDQFSGTVVGIGGDTPCLDETLLSNATSSFQIKNLREYILSTNACENCILTGVDFSDDDLSNGVFSGSTFLGANLTNTNFNGAALTSADFSGATTTLSQTDFTDASLNCTEFNGANLTEAVFGDDLNLTKDFSCWLDASSAELNVSTFPTADWRYLDLTGAKIVNASGGTPLVLSTTDDPLDLSGAHLSGVGGLSGAILDGADLGCASGPQGHPVCSQLINTDLSKTSLNQANLSDAALNGANLSFANLTEADLSGAQLLKSPVTQTSASLLGALLKNANLASADLSGANLTNANWYSTSAGSSGCPGSTWTGTCASGQGALLSSADFEGAYLNGLDLSNATPQGAIFTGALLVGANFTGANLSRDPNTGATTKFAKAFLHGADFTDAITTGADFTSAYVDLSAGATLLFQLPVGNLEFAGYEPTAGSIDGCVEFSYSTTTVVPTTTSGNICPDAGNGPCTDTRWQSPTTPIENAVPPSTTDTINGLPNGCDISTMDFNWIFN